EHPEHRQVRRAVRREGLVCGEKLHQYPRFAAHYCPPACDGPTCLRSTDKSITADLRLRVPRQMPGRREGQRLNENPWAVPESAGRSFGDSLSREGGHFDMRQQAECFVPAYARQTCRSGAGKRLPSKLLTDRNIV